MHPEVLLPEEVVAEDEVSRVSIALFLTAAHDRGSLMGCGENVTFDQFVEVRIEVLVIIACDHRGKHQPVHEAVTDVCELEAESEIQNFSPVFPWDEQILLAVWNCSLREHIDTDCRSRVDAEEVILEHRMVFEGLHQLIVEIPFRLGEVCLVDP